MPLVIVVVVLAVSLLAEVDDGSKVGLFPESDMGERIFALVLATAVAVIVVLVVGV